MENEEDKKTLTPPNGVEEITAVSAPENNECDVKYRGVKAMPYIIGNETFEKLGTIGTMSNLTVYLTTVFNMTRVSVATLMNAFSGTSSLATLLGAYLSDTYFGRYKTLGFASISTFLGLLVITLIAAFTKLHPPPCSAGGSCIGPSAGQLALLFVAFGLMVVGSGGIRPCNLAFGADQFNPETKSGKRGIDSFFNWYYFTMTFSVMVSSTLIVYVQSDVSWGIGFAIPACLMFLSCVFLFWGSSIYVKVKPQGSPFTSVAQVFVAAIRKHRMKLPNNLALSLFNYVPMKSYNSKLPHTDQFKFLDKSTVITPEDQIKLDGSAAEPWKLCSIQQVEEVKCIVRVMPIWASAIMYYVASSQHHTYGIFQALQTDRRFGNTSFEIPAASYTVFSMLAVTIWVPLYDRVIVPKLRKLTDKEGGITLLQRMGVGLFLSAASMLVAGLVEKMRRDYALTKPTLGSSPKGGAVSSLPGFWLVPQLAVGGLAEAFFAIAQTEFYYKQFPENMRSIAGAVSNSSIAFASYLSSFLVSIVHDVTLKSSSDWLAEDLNKGRLDYFYFLIAGLGILNFGYFLVCARWYRYKGDGNSTVEVTSDRSGSEDDKTPV